MPIIDRVIAKRDEMVADRTGVKATANRDMAVRAMMDGIESTAWESYMSQFAGNAAELARLTTRDPTMSDELKVRRAYIVGNAICGSGTPANFDMGVDTIDDGINPSQGPGGTA